MDFLQDTKEVLQELIECKNNVCMITGDSLYTAAHVASEVGIARADKSLILFLKKTYFCFCFSLIFSYILIYSYREAELAWVDFEFESLRVRYSAAGRPCFSFYTCNCTLYILFLLEMKGLCERYSLCVDGDTLEEAWQVDPATSEYLQHISVFSRMKPAQKVPPFAYCCSLCCDSSQERVVACMKSAGLHVLMCGDGINDVGALKTADIGIALLNGFGNLNADSAKKRLPPTGKSVDLSSF
jgi:magnesium-transporting ATPase (P-type)